MREYEIRIFSQNHAQTVIEVMQLNDHGAIRAAKKMADGKLFEVWRDLDCIYSPAGERTHAHRLRPTGLTGCNSEAGSGDRATGAAEVAEAGS